MKLLFDENLSSALPRRLSSEYAGSVHARDIGLRGAPDRELWNHARLHGFTIVLIWLDLGNAGTDASAVLLEGEKDRVGRFGAAEDASLLILSAGLGAV